MPPGEGVEADPVTPTRACAFGPREDRPKPRPGNGTTCGRRSDSRVHLLFSTWSATADELGRFQFVDVAAGRQRIHATHPGYRTLQPLDTVMVAGDTLALLFRLRSGGPIEDCRVDAACAELLRQSELESLDSEERIRLAAYATIIANTWNTVAGDVRWYACVEESSTAVLSELSERYGRVASSDQCQRVVTDPEDRSPRLMHIDSGLPAYAIAIDRVRSLPGERRSASISYHVGPLWAAGWECVFEDASSGWQPLLCVLTWESQGASRSDFGGTTAVGTGGHDDEQGHALSDVQRTTR